MIVLKCDRCKTVLKDPLTDAQIKTRNTLTGKRFDLCIACTDATAAFIDGGVSVAPAAPTVTVTGGTAKVSIAGRTPSEMTRPPVVARPPECFEREDVYRWLLAEAQWVAGPVALAQHQIRLQEGGYEATRPGWAQ